MATGILIDQLGTYLVLSTLGVTLATNLLHQLGIQSSHLQAHYRISSLAGVDSSVRAHPFEFPDWVSERAEAPGRHACTPCTCYSVGLQLRLDQTRGIKSALATGLGFKLLLAPAVLALPLFRHPGQNRRDYPRNPVRAAMGRRSGARLSRFNMGLNPPLVSLMVGLGISLSFLTLPLWHMSCISCKTPGPFSLATNRSRRGYRP